MRFTVDTGLAPIVGALRYIERDHAFDFEPVDQGLGRAGLTLLVKDLCLELDARGRVCYPWGYSPRMSWRQAASADATGPNRLYAGVLVDDVDLTPGVAVSVGDWEDWDCLSVPTSLGLRVLYRNRLASDLSNLVVCRVATGFELAFSADTLVWLDLAVDNTNIR